MCDFGSYVSRILSACGDVPLSSSENIANVVVGVCRLRIYSLYMLCNDRNVILFSPAKI